MVTGQARPSGLEDLLDAARRLPVCDQTAKLHALIARLQYAAKAGETTAPVADALAAAATDALVDDPWVQFESVVRRFKSGHTLPSASPVPDPRSLIPDP